MKLEQLYLAWGTLFIVCAGFGFILEPSQPLRALMAVLSAGFFVPPAILLYRDHKAGTVKDIRRIRSLSIASLALTTVAIVANELSVYASEGVGILLHGFWVIVSAPMVCSGFGILTVFAWACLMVTCFELLKKK